VTYYGDLIYRQYVVDSHDRLGLVVKSMFNAVNMFRIVGHYSVWLLAGFFWCATFLSTPNVFIIFSWITYILIIWELARVFLTILATCISYFADDFDRAFKPYNHFANNAAWGAERVDEMKLITDTLWLDIELEMLNIGL
jgi:hypothetical protein